MLLSCLSAHAALTVFDGLEREPLPAKCTGVFPSWPNRADPLTVGLGSGIVLPHSRVNTVPTHRVRAAGYDVPLRSEEIGWSVATRTGRASPTWCSCRPIPSTGRPACSASTSGTSAGTSAANGTASPSSPGTARHPRTPNGSTSCSERIAAGERDPRLVESFPFADIEARAPWPWQTVATRLYANWLADVPARSR